MRLMPRPRGGVKPAVSLVDGSAGGSADGQAATGRPGHVEASTITVLPGTPSGDA